MSSRPDVVVMGLGYIGLPTAAILASRGTNVLGVDVNEKVVEAVSAGTVPFVEPDLAGYVSHAVATGHLRAAGAPEPADVFILAVPTPFQDDRTPDLGYIRSAAQMIAPVVEPGALVILESTSPPGATDQLATWLLEARPDLRAADGGSLVHVAHCPERVLPGRVMVELVSNDRIVGGLTREAAEKARDLYQIFCAGEILLTDAVTAEMAKLVENSFRDVNIAFANELSLVCDRLGIDVWELIRLANHHPRVDILQPGPGVGGHCIAVDPWFIVAAAPEESRLIRTAREVNDAKPQWVVDQVTAAVEGVDAPTVAVLGLAFKPDIDDLRESPARKIAADLADVLPAGRILAVEPHVEELPPELANRRNVQLTEAAEALDAADCVAVLVDHTVFRTLKPARGDVAVVDVKGLWRD